jgi:hypothetical protein
MPLRPLRGKNPVQRARELQRASPAGWGAGWVVQTNRTSQSTVRTTPNAAMGQSRMVSRRHCRINGSDARCTRSSQSSDTLPSPSSPSPHGSTASNSACGGRVSASNSERECARSSPRTPTVPTVEKPSTESRSLNRISQRVCVCPSMEDVARCCCGQTPRYPTRTLQWDARRPPGGLREEGKGAEIALGASLDESEGVRVMCEVHERQCQRAPRRIVTRAQKHHHVLHTLIGLVRRLHLVHRGEAGHPGMWCRSGAYRPVQACIS